MDLATIQREAWETARRKGLHDNLNSLPSREQTLIRLALIHTEVSEATQEVKRHGVTPQNLSRIAEELADTIIRIADLAQGLRIDVSRAVQRKLELNKHRPMYYGTPPPAAAAGPHEARALPCADRPLTANAAGSPIVTYTPTSLAADDEARLDALAGMAPKAPTMTIAPLSPLGTTLETYREPQAPEEAPEAQTITGCTHDPRHIRGCEKGGYFCLVCAGVASGSPAAGEVGHG